MNLPRTFYLPLAGGAILVAVAIGIARIANKGDVGVETVDLLPVKSSAHRVDTGLCPWRTPEADLNAFFPEATTTRDETVVLSGFRPAIAARLGHPPVGGDSALRVHRVLRNDRPLGVILTRNVRGESGVIELVVAVNPDGGVVGARVQRLREPDEVASALTAPKWLHAFCGKTSHSAWQLGQDIPSVPTAAQASALAILDGARTVLVLLDVGRNASVIR